MGQALPFYRQSPDAVLREFKTSADGLSSKEAALRLKRDGANKLDVARKESWFVTYLRQFRDLMIVLLVASGGLAMYLGDARTSIVLFVLVFFNTGIGFLQEFKAEKIMDSLEKLVVAGAHAQRDGKLVEVSSAELVPGDIVYIEEGDSVPADLRILSEEELATNDFALTGESNPSRKFVHAITGDVPLGNRHNIVFMGTTVATGHGYGVVVATGMQTELGRIANLSQDTTRETSPLQKEMNNIATRVTQGTMILCAILLPIAISNGLVIKEAFLFAIGIASSIIPQGLPAEINTALAQAAGRLARARALIKKLSSVETLGATDVICTDKTGTLTKNQMTVEQLLIGKNTYNITGTGYEAIGEIQDQSQKTLSKKELAAFELFFATGAMASNAKVNSPDNEHSTWYCVGDPTEGALITLARKAGVEPLDLDKKYSEIKEFQFDSARKRMSSVRNYNGEIWVFTKGAPENVLERSTTIWDHGHVRKLTAKDRHSLLKYNEDRAAQAMRNLGFAYGILPKGSDPTKMKFDEVEQHLTFMGIVSMVDPLREEVPAAMQIAQDAHIKVSIITGDYPTTAEAIAKKAGLRSTTGKLTIVMGDRLPHMSDSEIFKLIEQGGTVFSRVAPEDKLRIVELIKKRGKVVAVTGDGINDAPALKRADIGVAMGKTGTDVAKQSSEIILLDDSFSTLVGAVQQGRTIFQNIRKGALSCFTSNAAELVVNLVSLAVFAIFHIPIAISVMQILAVDLIAELFPIAALGWDKADGELMRQKPRDLGDHILNKHSIRDLLGCGLLIGGLAYLNYLWFFQRNNISPEYLQTTSNVHFKATALTYLTIVLCQLANILQRRSSGGLFTRYQLHNRHLWVAILFSLVCVANIIYNPWIAPYFHSAPLSFVDWLYALGAMAIFIAFREFLRHNHKHTRKAVVALHQSVTSRA